MNIERGYLFITDITGYTEFLTHSELDHASEILDALFDSILEHLHPPMIVSGTQGDAIICYFPEGAFDQPQSIIEGMERIYTDFHRQLSLMELNSTCTCKACANMSSLDLKVFLHFGQYMLQKIGENWDLQGSDIILIHRLMKNKVREKFGLTGYGLITEAAVGAMGIEDLTEGMHTHVEQVEHFGNVGMYVYDLRSDWETRQKTDHQIVTPDDAMVWAEIFLPIPQWVAWDLSLNSDIKARFFSNVKSLTRVDKQGGRIAPGAKFHCAHSFGFRAGLDYIVLDVDAPNYLTSRNYSLGINYLLTLSFRPVEGGTMFSALYGWPNVKIPKIFSAIFRAPVKHHVKTFARIVDEEIAAGRIQPEHLEEIAGRKGEFLRPEVGKGRFADLAGKKS